VPAPQAAATAASAYFGAVTHLLLGEPSGERAGAWEDPRWRDHLVATYRSERARPNQQWLLVDPARQALAYAVADSAGPLSSSEVSAVLERHGTPNAHGRLHQYTAKPEEADAVQSTCWSWPPTVIRHYLTGRSWVAEPRRCPRCGRPAELVVNVPELPFRCMCVCGGAAGPAWRSPRPEDLPTAGHPPRLATAVRRGRPGGGSARRGPTELAELLTGWSLLAAARPAPAFTGHAELRMLAVGAAENARSPCIPTEPVAKWGLWRQPVTS
jgi:hypothetical protein